MRHTRVETVETTETVVTSGELYTVTGTVGVQYIVLLLVMMNV